GARVRITTQLVDAVTEEQLWAETYDRDARNVLDVQSDVASKVAAALAVRLTQAERAKLRRGETSDPQAYDAYLRGLSKVERVWNFESANTLQNALESAEASAADFERAVALDPNYAVAHARLGSAYLDLGLYLDANNPAWLPKARGELDRALELEPALALPHIARARVLFSQHGGWNADAAVAELERARALDPDATPAGMTYLLRHLGLERALPEAELAHQLDPASEKECGAVLGALQMTGRWSESIARAQELGPCGDEWALDAMTRLGRATEVLERIRAHDAEHGVLLP